MHQYPFFLMKKLICANVMWKSQCGYGFLKALEEIKRKQLTLRSFLVPTRKRRTLEGSLSLMASSSHSLNKHRQVWESDMIHDYSDSVLNQIPVRVRTIPCMIQRVIIAQVKHNNDGWKQKNTLFLHNNTARVCII